MEREREWMRCEGKREREREVGAREIERLADAWLYSLGGYIRPAAELRGSIGAWLDVGTGG